MTIIIGIDPGSRFTGYGVVRVEGNKQSYIASGCIRVTADDIAQRLLQVNSGISEIITEYQVTDAAIEQVFMHRNPNSAIKLGQARGAAIVAVGQQGLQCAEYSAREIKQAVVGTGAGAKEQVQYMVKMILQLKGEIQSDAADALAVALCHANVRKSLATLQKATD